MRHQACTNRIGDDVARNRPVILIPAQRMVVIAMHPEWSIKIDVSSDLSRKQAFEPLHDLRQSCFTIQLNQAVPVIRHQYPA